MKRNHCKDCRWWEDSAEKILGGLNADMSLDAKTPRMVRLGTCHRTHHFEATNEEDWCGDFETRPLE